MDCLCAYCYHDHRDLHSFPTRRSSDLVLAIAKIPEEEVIRRYKAARDYALKLPRANGKSASLGIGMGGADSFRFAAEVDRKSTRLNSSHLGISYAVFCLKKKKEKCESQ